MTENELNKYFESAEFKAGLARYEEMISGGVRTYFEAEQLTDIAEYYAKNNQLEKASEAIEMALKLHPGSTDPLIFKARTYMLQGDLAKAYELAESIPDQGDREVAFLYAELMLCEKRPDEAAEYMKTKLLQGEFDDTPEEIYNTVHDITLLFYDNKFYEHGIQWAQRQMQYAKNTRHEVENLLTAKEMLASCHLGCEHLEEAIVLFNEVIDGNPYNERAWMILGDIYSIMQQWEKAMDAYDYALAINSEMYICMLGKANCYSQLGNMEKAAELYDQLSQIGFAPSLVDYHYGLALTLFGKFDEAIPHLLKSWENPDDDDMLFDSCYNLCLSYLGTGDVKTASQFFYLAQELSPDSPEVNDLVSMFQLCLDKLNEFESDVESKERQND